MKTALQVSIIVVVVAILLVLSGTFYTLEEGQQAVIVQFGRPVGETVTEAGLHVKLPFVQAVRRFEKRLLTWDGDPNQIPTKGREFIWVDTTARWRIADAKKFLENVASEEGAQSRLDDIIDSVVRDQVSSSELIELVRSASWEVPAERAAEIKKEVAAEREEEIKKEVTRGREEITRTILAEARKIMPQYGIELVDVRIKRLDYIESVREKVYARMVSERKRIAAQFRSEGEGRSAEVLGAMEKELRQNPLHRLPAGAGAPGRGRRGGDAHLWGSVQSRSRVLCLLAHAGNLWRGREQELRADPHHGQRLLPLSQACGSRGGSAPPCLGRSKCQESVEGRGRLSSLVLFQGGTSGSQATGVYAGTSNPSMMRLAMQESSTGQRQPPKGAASSETRHGAAPLHETGRTRGRLDERKGNNNDGWRDRPDQKAAQKGSGRARG